MKMVPFEQVSLSIYKSLMRLREIDQPQILELQNFISNFISLCNVVPYYYAFPLIKGLLLCIA